MNTRRQFEGRLVTYLLPCPPHSANFSHSPGKGSFSHLPRRSDHYHHLLQVELISGEVFDGHFIFNLTVRFPGIIEQLPEVADPGLQQDELRREPLQNHGQEAVWAEGKTQMIVDEH